MSTNDQVYYLDFLYGQCYSQLLRSRVSPTYVEKRILGEHVQVIRNYLLQFVDELKKNVDDYKTQSDASYVVWDRTYYEEQAKTRGEALDEFKKKLTETKPEDFLSVDFTSINEELEIAYPGHLPKSLVRENLNKEWEVIKSKHD